MSAQFSTVSTKYTIRVRLTVLLLILLTLAFACLNIANARLCSVLQDRARSDSIATTDDILEFQFQRLLRNVQASMIAMAITSIAFVIYGIVFLVHPRWMREPMNLFIFACIQFALALVMLGTGAYIAGHVYGLDASFEKFGNDDSIPYYSMIYHGGVAQAAYGSTLVFLAIVTFVIFYAIDHYKTNRNWAEATTGDANEE